MTEKPVHWSMIFSCLASESRLRQRVQQAPRGGQFGGRKALAEAAEDRGKQLARFGKAPPSPATVLAPSPRRSPSSRSRQPFLSTTTSPTRTR